MDFCLYFCLIKHSRDVQQLQLGLTVCLTLGDRTVLRVDDERSRVERGGILAGRIDTHCTG